MKLKSYLLVTSGIVIFLVSFLGYVYFSKTPQFEEFFHWSQNNLYLFIPVVLLFKIAGVVYPPLPSVVFTIAAIPILGWFPAYLIDLTGSLAAGAIDYYLGKRYGYRILNKLFDSQVVEKIKTIRVKPGREIESVIVMRILLGGIIIEAIYYGAGLLGIRFKNFMIGTSVSHIILGIPTFLIGSSIFQAQNLLISITLGVTAILIIYKVKGRYFE